MSIVSSSKDPVLKRQLQRSPNGGGDTAQGFYVIGADGKLYGWNNAHYTPETLKFIDTALEAFRRDPPVPIHLTEEQMTASFHRRRKARHPLFKSSRESHQLRQNAMI